MNLKHHTFLFSELAFIIIIAHIIRGTTAHFFVIINKMLVIMFTFQQVAVVFIQLLEYKRNLSNLSI